MKGSTKRIFSILFSAAILIAAVVVYSDFVVPEYDHVNVMRGELAAKQQTLDSEREVVNQVNSLLTKYKSIPDLRNVMSLALPGNEGTSEAFSQLYSLVNFSGLSIQQFGISSGSALTNVAPKSTGTSIIRNIGSAQITLYVTGSYSSFKGFMQALEKNIRIMDVASLKMQPLTKANQDLFFYNIVINTYYQS
jgi:Tfp pilus assembly protein PilO